MKASWKFDLNRYAAWASPNEDVELSAYGVRIFGDLQRDPNRRIYATMELGKAEDLVRELQKAIKTAKHMNMNAYGDSYGRSNDQASRPYRNLRREG